MVSVPVELKLRLHTTPPPDFWMVKYADNIYYCTISQVRGLWIGGDMGILFLVRFTVKWPYLRLHTTHTFSKFFIYSTIPEEFDLKLRNERFDWLSMKNSSRKKSMSHCVWGNIRNEAIWLALSFWLSFPCAISDSSGTELYNKLVFLEPPQDTFLDLIFYFWCSYVPLYSVTLKITKRKTQKKFKSELLPDLKNKIILFPFRKFGKKS